jgi:hypothetical protein
MDSPDRPIVFLARREVGHLTGEVRGAAGPEARALEVVLRDPAEPDRGQRLVLPIQAYGRLVELVQDAARRLDEEDGPARLPRVGGPPALAWRHVHGFGQLLAAAVMGAFSRTVVVEIVHGTETGLGRQSLLVERSDLPALLALLQGGQRAMAGAESERRGVLGHA